MATCDARTNRATFATSAAKRSPSAVFSVDAVCAASLFLFSALVSVSANIFYLITPILLLPAADQRDVHAFSHAC
jgi:hypothetical protein